MHSSKSPMSGHPIVTPLFYILAATSILCAMLISFRETQILHTNFKFLLWNLFLAWLPLVVSMTALIWTRLAKGTILSVGLVVSGIVWLLLYPNASYLTTDLIHLIFMRGQVWYDKEGLLLWYDLVLFFLFMWCGLLLGFLSMSHYYAIIITYWKQSAGWAFFLISSYLGGFGVYLGRVMRLNSWDVLKPSRLIEKVFEAINMNAAVFTVLFGTLILIVNLSLYALTMKPRTQQ